jgi:hypothetical protein
MIGMILFQAPTGNLDALELVYGNRNVENRFSVM